VRLLNKVYKKRPSFKRGATAKQDLQGKSLQSKEVRLLNKIYREKAFNQKRCDC